MGFSSLTSMTQGKVNSTIKYIKKSIKIKIYTIKK